MLKKSELNEATALYEALGGSGRRYGHFDHVGNSLGSASLHALNELKGEDLDSFLKHRSALHSQFLEAEQQLAATHLKEQHKTQRISMLIAAFLILVAMAAVIFAPVEKQQLSFWVGGSLLVAVVGLLGYSRLSVKTDDLSFNIEREHNN